MIGGDVHLLVLVGVIEEFECLSSEMIISIAGFKEISKLQRVVDNRN